MKIKRITLPVSLVCNLSCKNCSVFDFIGGKPLRYKYMTPGQVKEILDKLVKCEIEVGQVTLAGAEPFMNPDIGEIVDIVNSYGFKEVEIITNGTLLNKKNLEILKKVSNISISIYPHTKSIQETLEKEGLVKEFDKNSYTWLRVTNDMYKYNQNVKIEDVQHNYDICSMKDKCLVVTTAGVYRCWVLYRLEQDICPYDKEKLQAYLSQKEPYGKCASCDHWLTPRLKHECLNPENDKKVVETAIKLIKKAKGDTN